MSLGWLDPHFNTAATALALAAVVFLVCVEPLLGRRTYRRLTRIVAGNPGALRRFYLLTLSVQWAWALVTVAVIAVAPGIHRTDLGIAWPTGTYGPVAIGVAVYFIVTVLITGLALRRRARQGRAVPGQGTIVALLPRTRPERRLALGLAITAGTCEELLCRGLLIATGVGVGHLSPYLAAAIGVVVFGVAHLYQGLAGVLGTMLLGVIMTGLYLASASLLLPILAHIAIDIRGLLIIPAPEAAPADG